MIGVEILSTGALKEAYLKQAAAEYEKRLSAYCRVSNLVYKPGASPAGLLKDKAYKVALCVEGDQLSSEELAETIKKAALSGRCAAAVCHRRFRRPAGAGQREVRAAPFLFKNDLSPPAYAGHSARTAVPGLQYQCGREIS